MIIVKNRTAFFFITGMLVLASLISVAVFGLKLSTDFTGGTLVEVTYPGGRPAISDLTAALTGAEIKGFSLREALSRQVRCSASGCATSDSFHHGRG